MDPSQYRHLLGRDQGPELLSTPIVQATLARVPLQGTVNVDRPLAGIDFVWRGRVVIATANLSPIACEAPATVIENFTITGTSKKWGFQTLWNVSGATAFAYARQFQTKGNALLIGTGTSQTLAPELSIPIAAVGATFGNTGTFDVEIHYYLPFCLFMGKYGKVSALPFSLDPADWSGVQANVTFGDATSFGTLGSATVTFTAYNSASGTPTVSCYGDYFLLGALQGKIRHAVVLRSENPNATFTTANGSAGALFFNPALQNAITSNVLIKSGVKLTGTSGGVNVFSTLNDQLLTGTQLKMGNKLIRNIQDNFATKAYWHRAFDTVQPQGYMGFTFVENFNPRSSYRGDNPRLAGVQFGVWTGVNTASANNVVSVLQEQILCELDANRRMLIGTDKSA